MVQKNFALQIFCSRNPSILKTDPMARMFQRTGRLSCLLLLGVLFFIIEEVVGQSGTTPNIQGIFMQRCQDFQQMHPEVQPKNCTFLWDIFLNSFKNKDRCNVVPSDYSTFFQEASKGTFIKDKALFWSLVNPFVYKFTTNQIGKYTTILDLLPGYILDNLTWCWSSANNSLDYDSCPPYRSANCSAAVLSSWMANSAHFSELSNGKVFAMLNGSTTIGAFTNISIFYTVEVPAMASPRITEMDVILVQNLNGPVTEYCNSGTLLTLKNELQAKNIAYNCQENPPEVVTLLCQLYPENKKNPKCSTTNQGLSVNRASLITIFLFAVAMRYMSRIFAIDD